VVYVTDHEELNAKIFQKEQEFDQQRQIFSTKTLEMENIFQNEMSKKDKELDELRHSLDILRQVSQVEKIVEVIKEVPVEKIVIQEKIVEVEKESIDSNLKTKFDALQSTVQKLKLDNIEKDKQLREYEKTIEEIQKFQVERKAAFLKGSNLDDTLYSKKL
jgi:D-mannonate dehydratase